MSVTEKVRQILGNYESDNPGTKANLARILMQGTARRHRQAGHPAGRPGLRARPGAQLRAQPAGLRPALSLPARARCRALGLCRAARHDRGGRRHLRRRRSRPSSRSTAPTASPAARIQAVTASVDDALRLGCSAIGFTIYPGSDDQFDDDGGDSRAGARSEVQGPRRRHLVLSARRRPHQGRRDGDRHLRLCRAHGGAARRPHHQGQAADRSSRTRTRRRRSTRSRRSTSAVVPRASRHVVQSCFNGRRIVVFSGGEAKDEEGIYDEARAIRDGGGNGSIIGRNTFQRPREDALKMLDHPRQDLSRQGLTAIADELSCRLYLVTPAGSISAVRGARWRGPRRRRRGVRCSFASRMSTTTRSAARPNALRPVVQKRDVAFILNDRPDLAAATGCDGVHVGQEDASYDEAARRLGPDRIVGVTCHDSPRSRDGCGRGRAPTMSHSAPSSRRRPRMRRAMPHPGNSRTGGATS